MPEWVRHPSLTGFPRSREWQIQISCRRRNHFGHLSCSRTVLCGGQRRQFLVFREPLDPVFQAEGLGLSHGPACRQQRHRKPRPGEPRGNAPVVGIEPLFHIVGDAAVDLPVGAEKEIGHPRSTHWTIPKSSFQTKGVSFAYRSEFNREFNDSNKESGFWSSCLISTVKLTYTFWTAFRFSICKSWQKSSTW